MTAPGIDILNTGTGHTEIRFNNGDPIEVERARRVVVDMLRRGYVLFVHEGDRVLRVESFDSAKDVYIIAEGPLYSGDDDRPPITDPVGAASEPPAKRKGRPPRTREVPLTEGKVTAIGRSAGG